MKHGTSIDYGYAKLMFWTGVIVGTSVCGTILGVLVIFGFFDK